MEHICYVIGITVYTLVTAPLLWAGYKAHGAIMDFINWHC